MGGAVNQLGCGRKNPGDLVGRGAIVDCDKPYLSSGWPHTTANRANRSLGACRSVYTDNDFWWDMIISRSGARRTTRTDDFKSVTNFFETLPSNSRPTADLPCEPTTTRSGLHSLALPISSRAGLPIRASARTSNQGRVFEHGRSPLTQTGWLLSRPAKSAFERV